MSSLPHISHHLYVAAVCQEGRAESGNRTDTAPAAAALDEPAPALSAPGDPLRELLLDEAEPVQLAFGPAWT